MTEAERIKRDRDERSRAIQIGNAMVVYDMDVEAWILPGGRITTSHQRAREVCYRISRMMERRAPN